MSAYVVDVLGDFINGQVYHRPRPPRTIAWPLNEGGDLGPCFPERRILGAWGGAFSQVGTSPPSGGEAQHGAWEAGIA